MSNLTPSQVQNAKNVACEKCNNEVFTQGFIIKHISALITQSGKDMMAPVPIFICSSCKHINKVFSEELKINQQINNSDTLNVAV
jgi:hypothetical protein